MTMKVIGSYISGRLGNQMFQYAFAKAVKIAQGGTGQLVLNFKRVYQAGNEESGFEDSLKYFNVEPYKTEKGNLVLKYCSIWQIIVYLAYVASIKLFHADYSGEHWLSLLRKMGLLYSSFFDNRYSIYDRHLHSVVRWNCLVCLGKYENPLYFNHIRPILLLDFTPKEVPLSKNRHLYEIIENCNSVCVSVRRGDYLSSKFKKDFFICDEAYFKKAIERGTISIRPWEAV